MNRRFLSYNRDRRHSRRRVANVWFLLALAASGVPAHAQKPELLDPRVTQSTIVDTICRPGYADDVLPPFDTLQRQKEQLLSQRHVDPQSASDYALDHRMPILLGGSPSAAANLDIRRWDGRAGQRRKERLAVFLKRCVRAICRWQRHRRRCRGTGRAVSAICRVRPATGRDHLLRCAR
jgi:hypothetical protein